MLLRCVSAYDKPGQLSARFDKLLDPFERVSIPVAFLASRGRCNFPVQHSQVRTLVSSIRKAHTCSGCVSENERYLRIKHSLPGLGEEHVTRCQRLWRCSGEHSQMRNPNFNRALRADLFKGLQFTCSDWQARALHVSPWPAECQYNQAQLELGFGYIHILAGTLTRPGST